MSRLQGDAVAAEQGTLRRLAIYHIVRGHGFFENAPLLPVD